MTDDRTANRACLTALAQRGTTDDGEGLWSGVVEQVGALLARPEWTDADSWTALHVAAYHLPRLKELGLAPVEPEGEPEPVPNALANQYTAWWGPKDALAISRRRAQEARIAAGLEAAPDSFVPSQRYVRSSPMEVARVEAVKGVLLVRRGGRLPMVADRLRPFVLREGNGHLQLALRPGVCDAVRLLVTKEDRLTVTPEASALLADFENQMRARAQPTDAPADEA